MGEERSEEELAADAAAEQARIAEQARQAEDAAMVEEEQAMEDALNQEDFRGPEFGVDAAPGPTLGDEALYEDQEKARKIREEEAAQQQREQEEAEAKAPFDEMKGEIDALRQDLRQRDGKLGDMNRQNIELRETVNRLQQQGVSTGLSAERVGEILQGTPEFKAILEEYDEIGQGVMAAITAAVTAAQGPAAPAPTETPEPPPTEAPAPQEQLTPEDIATMARHQIAMEDLNSKHADWADRVQTLDYVNWMELQEDDFKALENSPDPHDVIRVMDEFQAFQTFVEAVPDEYANLNTKSLLDLMRSGTLESATSESDAVSDGLSPAERLRASVSPTSGDSIGGEGSGAKSEEDYMEEAFNAQRG